MAPTIADVYADNVSTCCFERLKFYDEAWDDGVCSKCNEHSPAHREEGEEK